MMKNCGCQERKDIMFTQGNLGVTEFIILAAAVSLVIVAWKVNR